MNATGQLIRNRRLALEMSQIGLAKKLKISSAFINKVETGRGRWPKKRINQLCKALDLRRRQLIAVMISDYYQ